MTPLSNASCSECGKVTPELRWLNRFRLVCSDCYFALVKSSKLRLLPGEFHQMMGKE